MILRFALCFASVAAVLAETCAAEGREEPIRFKNVLAGDGWGWGVAGGMLRGRQTPTSVPQETPIVREHTRFLRQRAARAPLFFFGPHKRFFLLSPKIHTTKKDFFCDSHRPQGAKMCIGRQKLSQSDSFIRYEHQVKLTDVD